MILEDFKKSVIKPQEEFLDVLIKTLKEIKEQLQRIEEKLTK